MPDDRSTSPRRDFLSGMAAFGAAIGLADLTTTAEAADTGGAPAAMQVFSGRVAKAMGLPARQVYPDWMGGVLPGVTVLPSGVVGVVGVVGVEGAQARGCTYCFAG